MYQDNANPIGVKMLSNAIDNGKIKEYHNAINILELGCSTGYLGKVMKDRYKKINWTGLELDQEAIGHAKKRLDLVKE